MRQFAQLVNGQAKPFLCPIDPRHEVLVAIRAQLGAHEAQREREAHEALLGAVV